MKILTNLEKWRDVGAKDMCALDLGQSARGLEVTLNTSDRVQVYLRRVSEEGELEDGHVFLGVVDGMRTIKYHVQGPCVIEIKRAKGVVAWWYDDRDPLEADAPVGESFTNLEKRGMMQVPSLDEMMIYRSQVMRRLAAMSDEGREHRRQQDRANEQITRMSKKIEELLRAQPPKTPPDDSADDTGADGEK